jgi:DNA-binding transcriptional LysR family regulator
MSWDDIRYFLEVVRSGNVTTAARNLDVNHSTVSRRIRALEENHGVRLFERVPGGYKMTAAAGGIYELALEIETRNQQIARYLFGQDNRLQGSISLTMPHDILEFCLIDDLKEFSDQYPEIDLNLYVAKGLKNLAAREADIALRLTPSPPEYLIGKRITLLQHGIYTNVNIDLKAPRLVVWGSETALPTWALDHFPNAEIAMRVDDLYSMYVAVKAGVGIARMPCYLPDQLADPIVKRMDLTLPGSDWCLWVLSHADLRHTLRVQHCRNFLIQVLEKRKDLFQGKLSKYQ